MENVKKYFFESEILHMAKIVVVGTNHAGTASIKTMLSNYGSENEIVTFDQNSNISFLGCGMALWIGEQIDGPEGLFYSDKEQLEKQLLLTVKNMLNHTINWFLQLVHNQSFLQSKVWN